MSNNSLLKMTALAAAFTVSVGPMIAAAEVSGNLAIASQYLWRGQTLLSGGTVSGGLDYNHKSGLYTGVWASSESDKNEYDLYLGFGSEAGDFSYDLGFTSYHYTGEPGTGNGPDDLNFQEAHLALGFANFGTSAHFGVGDYGWGAGAAKNKDNYFTLSYAQEKFSALVGFYSFDDSSDNYTHLDLNYEVYDGLVFTASKIIDEKTEGTWSDELQFVVSYNFSF